MCEKKKKEAMLCTLELAMKQDVAVALLSVHCGHKMSGAPGTHLGSLAPCITTPLKSPHALSVPSADPVLG